MRCSLALGLLVLAGRVAAADDVPRFQTEIAPLLKARCVKCHGPAVHEGKLNLSTAAGVSRGGESGAVVASHDLAASLLWKRVSANEMPPETPLTADEKSLLKKWIVAGAPGLPTVRPGDVVEADHWSFRPLRAPAVPAVKQTAHVATPVDAFIQSTLESHGLTLARDAGRETLLRRASFTLTGLPPTVEQLEAFLSDRSPEAWPRAIERMLASPHYGERWGKYWLDAAGYADSNGYFGADTDRPLAYRYRDYVVRSFNADKPFDRFVREQLAGDEMAEAAGFAPDSATTPEVIELLEATHYLRNGQDGSGESDGNPDEVRADRYYALESCMQNVTTSLLALTLQCAKCHDHKFEPISQRDFYRFQAIFYPVFPLENWVKPNDRFVQARLAGELERWQGRVAQLDTRAATLRSELDAWVRAHRPHGEPLFADEFDAADGKLAPRWSATAPGDDAPGGKVPVRIDEAGPPSAVLRNGSLQIVEGGTQGDSWISTTQSFDWTPEAVGEAIQATFDLVDNRIGEGTPAMRIGYLIAMRDFDHNGPVRGGNILIDGNPGAGSAVYLEYPSAKGLGELGKTGYQPGHNYGIRVTNLGEGKYKLEQLVDYLPEEKSLTLSAGDLPDGGFGFEYCCGRSFIVDNVRIERFRGSTGSGEALAGFLAELKTRRAEHDKVTKERSDLGAKPPGKLSWASDVSPKPPEVPLLVRGNYSTPGEKVEPGAFTILSDADNPYRAAPPTGSRTTGRRTALADWLTRPGSRPAALMARVQVNRIWQHCFGTGIVATHDNLGLSSAPPSHPELLDWLAAEFIRSGWSHKHVLRLILASNTYRQTSEPVGPDSATPPDDRLLARYPLQRLDAEAVRDAMLAASGDLDERMGGPYVPTTRNAEGEVVATEGTAGSHRRSIYLYQKRTQIVSFLVVFDAPSIVFNSTQRARSTTPLQSLALWNSGFVTARAASLATRLTREEPDAPKRIERAFRMVLSRGATAEEVSSAEAFLAAQTATYKDAPDAALRAWTDFCQALLAGNAFLYAE